MASMVTMHPSISLDLSSTFTCAKTNRFLLAQALTIWIAVLPSIAISSAPPHPRQKATL